MQIIWINQSNKTLLQLTRLIVVLVLSLALSVCATQKPFSDDVQSPSSLPVADSAELPAVIQQLIQQADQQYYKHNYTESLATLERALRIKPKLPEIWSRMAQSYLQLKKNQQAKQHAKRSNSYIKNDSALKQFNNQLIQSVEQGTSH